MINVKMTARKSTKPQGASWMFNTGLTTLVIWSL
jgi:hypothetical protein